MAAYHADDKGWRACWTKVEACRTKHMQLVFMEGVRIFMVVGGDVVEEGRLRKLHRAQGGRHEATDMASGA